MGSFPRSSSLDIHTRTMVATKVLISLCVVGLASAAPQLGVPVQRSGASEQVIVTNVVSALQPSIAAAVADALRSISLTSTSSNTGFSAGSNTGFSAGSNSGFSSTRGSGFSSNSAAVKEVATVKEAPTARPNYAYEFKVADDDELTYITHNEARDGDDVTGVYSYVDPTGALVTVNYQAGAMGYSQTLEKQDGAVDVSTRKVTTKKAVAKQTSAPTGAIGATFGSSNSRTRTSSSSASNRGSSSSFGSSSSSSSIDEAALIRQIISALQPQISSAVNGVISNNRQTAVRTVASNTGFSSGASRASAAGDRLTPLFGF